MSLRRVVITILAAGACCYAIWEAARVGLARTFTEKAALISLTDADRAVSFSAKDAETHYARGYVMQAIGDYRQAQIEFERAVQLRHQDYYLWLLLGVMRDQNHDQEGALQALQQATALAPAYARPRWQLGNLLLRMARVNDAFAELRKASTSDPALLPNVIDLAWGFYDHDPQTVVNVLQPETDNAHLALSLFFAQHNQSAAAVNQFFLSKTLSDPKAESVLEELLKARAFSDAYRAWARLRDQTTEAAGTIRDGDFESSIAVGQRGFGWQISPNISNIVMSIDAGEHYGGTRSLRIDFRGDSDPAAPLVTQLLLVKSQTHYRLSFAARSLDWVSAAAPVVIVSDVSDPKTPPLAESPPLRAEPNVWRAFAIDFSTAAQTQAIAISLARQHCANDPCPAFGSLWLDSFLLSEVVAR